MAVETVVRLPLRALALSFSRIEVVFMTIKEINETLDEIRLKADEPETAHSIEDVLFYTFIAYIASDRSCNDSAIRQKAQLVLTCRNIEFDRWYA